MRDYARDEALLARVKAGLDAGVEELAPAVQSRLRQSRQQAVALAERKRSWYLVVPRWVTAGGLTAVAVVVAASLWLSAPRQNLADKPAEELEVLTAQGHLDMYEELEFYRWLAEAHDRS
jgi:negative regulator of sigma E activity